MTFGPIRSSSCELLYPLDLKLQIVWNLTNQDQKQKKDYLVAHLDFKPSVAPGSSNNTQLKYDFCNLEKKYKKGFRFIQ